MNKNMHLLTECVEIIGAPFNEMMTKSMPPLYFFPLICKADQLLVQHTVISEHNLC